MPAKKGSKPIYVAGHIHSAFRKKLKEEGWTWGMTKKVESMLEDYTEREFTRAGSTQAGKIPDTRDVTGGEAGSLPGPGESENKELQPNMDDGKKRHRTGGKK